MEALFNALIATGNMYRQQKVSVPEPAKFEAFDLQALRSPDQNKHDSQGRPERLKRLEDKDDRVLADFSPIRS